jgi:ribosomal protein S18 acetylase RimI-like enzyme
MRQEAGESPQIIVEIVNAFNDTDLAILCEVTDAAIIDGGGFGWVKPPGRRVLESYYRGVLLVPERELFVIRVNGTIVGSAHLVMPPSNNEAQAFSAQLMHLFIAPYARGHGWARVLTKAVESRARYLGYRVLNLDVREGQSAAIRMYEELGFVRWGSNPNYAMIQGRMVGGFYYTKLLRSGKPGPAHKS